MNSNKYTLDRFEKDIAVFLKFPEEVEQLLIDRNLMTVSLQEGDIVEITQYNGTYHIEVLEDEIKTTRERVQNLIELLKKNNK
ncbi:hypothetical protein C7437_10773 [Psychrobacillus insolitus]|uniref:DUF3006 family protein n=1 Tax=Psychrobacillus insolitus TaxID=1461 RepID=A0A2W7MMH9_9BACI|nr:DUF3006 domain-containing protein [Psychrobacillus insolitus]PZX03116.1 hypothetical protein C7437_10773 [Psychrobacillus insolitus]